MDKHVCLLDLVGDFVDDDTLSFVVIKNIALGTNMEPTFAGGVHVDDSIDTVDGSTGWEIGAFDMLHVFFYRDIRFPINPGFQNGIHVQIHSTRHFG